MWLHPVCLWRVGPVSSEDDGPEENLVDPAGPNASADQAQAQPNRNSAEYTAAVESVVRQFAQYAFFGFTESQVRWALEVVGTGNAHGAGEWLITNCEKPDLAVTATMTKDF